MDLRVRKAAVFLAKYSQLFFRACAYFLTALWLFRSKNSTFQWVAIGFLQAAFLHRFVTELLRFDLITPGYCPEYRAILELLVQLVVQSEEVVYVLLFPDCLDIILIYTAYWYTYDFIFRSFYKFPEIDDFTSLIMFFLSVAFQSVAHKSVGTFAGGLLYCVCNAVLKFGQIRMAQWYLLNRNELPTVAVYCSNSSESSASRSADVGHLYVRVGSSLTYEIFKNDRGGISGKKIVPQRGPRPAFKWHGSDCNFYIPFVNYGVVGLVHGTCVQSPEVADIIYEALTEDLDYNSSTKSCQEFAFTFASQLIESATAVRFFTTNLKAAITTLALAAPFLAAAIWWNVQISWVN